MKFVIIGGVAAGTKTAAKIKRCMRDAEVKIITRSRDISYAGCGLPYYVGHLIDTREELIVNTPEKFEGLTGVKVVISSTVTHVDPSLKKITVQTENGASYEEGYDKLIISTGADAFIPPVSGTELSGVFCVRTPDDAIAIRAYLAENSCRKAVVCGAGFIGLEMAENLLSQNLSVTVMDAAPQIMPNAFDREMADYAKDRLKEAGIHVLTSVSLTGIQGTRKVEGVTTSQGSLPADLVILAIGIRPATGFLKNSGINMSHGVILVDEYMQTNLPDIYAVGDCAMVKNAITGQPQWSAMGSTANLTARALAKTLTGTPTPYPGCLGTGVVRLLPSLSCGRTGLTEEQAVKNGFVTESCVCVLDDKAHYYPDSSSFIIKLLAEKTSRRLLGLQVFGAGSVDKITDIAVTGLMKEAVLDDFDLEDFAYAPPFSTAIHPFATACYMLENKIAGSLETFSPAEYAAGAASAYQVIDVQQEHKIPNAAWIDLASVTGPLDGIPKDAPLLLVCARGKRGYFLQNRLKFFGYTNTRVLEGGSSFNHVIVPRSGRELSPAEIKRVKGLGCLQDKRYPDIFNVRIITRNGKITSEEQRIIAEAAEKFGSGEITMTTRQTLEIQGVPYDKIQDVIDYVGQYGLETGGTGSKIRPIVSCKGTTCQYGLLDTFDLSQKLHEKFYIGYHGIDLPHKFKIAVGGCPNNCVKPNLNDIGIIGQSIPETDLSRCCSCSVCQVVNACPVKAARIENGKIVIPSDQCNNCGHCIGKCPFDAVKEYSKGYKIYIGGRWGKKIAQGRELDTILTSEEEVLNLVERAILFFRNEGISGERFSDTIERLGFDYVQDKLLHSTIDKEAVLKKKVTGGATC